MAENGLIPLRSTISVKYTASSLAFMELAQRLGIHPAIVAGRVRHATGNYRLLSHFVGTGTVRKQLLEGRTS
jgi:HTH-type transcriptional regulator/antitoxin HigA